MGYEAKKTEHCGPKRGNGAYWGHKWEAKKESTIQPGLRIAFLACKTGDVIRSAFIGYRH